MSAWHSFLYDFDDRQRSQTMGPFRRLLMNRAAKAFAIQLHPWLQRQFGASEFYTPPQIKRGVDALRLSRDHIVLAYAVFLSEAAFNTLGAETPHSMSYHEARAVLARVAPMIWASTLSFLDSGETNAGSATLGPD